MRRPFLRLERGGRGTGFSGSADAPFGHLNHGLSAADNRTNHRQRKGDGANSIRAIQPIFRHGVRLIVWCKECKHQIEPAPAEMAARYGAETPVLDWRERLVCPRYGRQVDMVVSGRNAPTAAAPRPLQ
jgi:hypothetical protein